jgi:hypothetical protein
VKPHELKKQKQNKSKKEGEKQRVIKNQIKKRRKYNKMLSQRSEKGQKKTCQKGNKIERSKDQGSGT